MPSLEPKHLNIQIDLTSPPRKKAPGGGYMVCECGHLNCHKTIHADAYHTMTMLHLVGLHLNAQAPDCPADKAYFRRHATIEIGAIRYRGKAVLKILARRL